MCDTMTFDESKHPRDKDGKFTDGGGKVSTKEMIHAFVEAGKELPLDRYGALDTLRLAEEYEKLPKTSEQSSAQKTYDVIAPSGNERVIKEGTPIKIGGKSFKYTGDVRVYDVITIANEEATNRAKQIAKNTETPFGFWKKKGGNAIVEISGEKVKRQIHWFEMRGQKATSYKIVKEDKKK